MGDMEFEEINDEILKEIGLYLIEKGLMIVNNAKIDEISVNQAREILARIPKIREVLSSIKDVNTTDNILSLAEEVETKYNAKLNP